MTLRIPRRVSQHFQKWATLYLILAGLVAVLGFADWLTSPRPTTGCRVFGRDWSPFHPDGETVLTVGRRLLQDPVDSWALPPERVQEPVRVWDTRTGLKHESLQAGRTYIARLSPDSNWVVRLNNRLGVTLWNVHQPTVATLYPSLSVSRQEARDLINGVGPRFVFAPDSRFLAVGAERETVVDLWELASGRIAARLPGATTPLVFSPDGRMLATGSVAGGAFLWEVPSGARRMHLSADSPKASQLAFSPDRRMLAGEYWHPRMNYAHLWDLAGGGYRSVIPRVPTSPENPWLAGWLSFSPDSRFLNVSGTAWECLVWDVRTTPPIPAEHLSVWYPGVNPRTGKAEPRPRYPVFSADGRWVAIGGPEQVSWAVLERESLTRVALLPADDGGTTMGALNFSADGTLAAVTRISARSVAVQGKGTLWRGPRADLPEASVRVFTLPRGDPLGEVPGEFHGFVGPGNTLLTCEFTGEELVGVQEAFSTYHTWELPLRRRYSLALGVIAFAVVVVGVCGRRWWKRHLASRQEDDPNDEPIAATSDPTLPEAGQGIPDPARGNGPPRVHGLADLTPACEDVART